MSRTWKTVGGAISLGSTRVVINFLNLASMLVLARLLTPADFGIVAIASAILSVVLSVTELSLSSALVHHDDPTGEHVDTVWTMSVIRSALVVLVLTAAAVPISIAYNDVRLVPVVVVSGVTGAFMGLCNPMISMQTRNMHFKQVNLIQLTNRLAAFVFTVALALAFKSYWSIIIGNTIGAALATGASFFLVRYRPSICLAQMRDILRFSGWISLKQLVETVNWRFDQLALGLLVPKAQIGFYAMADGLSVTPTRELLEPIRQVIFPSFVGIRGNGDQLRSAYLRAQSGIALLAMPAGIALALVAEPAVRLALGEKWLPSVPFVQVLAIAHSLQGFAPCVQALAMALGETRTLFGRQVFILVCRVPLTLIGITAFGAIGAAYAILISYVLALANDFRLAKALIGVRYRTQLRSHGFLLFGIAAMCLALVFVDPQVYSASGEFSFFNLVALICLGAISYAGSILGLWFLRGRPAGPVAELLSIAGKLCSAKKSLVS